MVATTSKRSAIRRSILPAAVVAAVALAGVAYVALTAAKPDREAGEPDRSGEVRQEAGRLYPTPSQLGMLTVRPVEPRVFRREFQTEGKIAVDEHRTTRIFSPYAGRVKQILVEPGDTIREGQPLFVVEAADSVDTQKDFVAAIAGLNKAQSQLALTQGIEQRMANLVKDKAMALKDWQEAQANVTAARNDLRTAEIALQAVRNRLRLIGKTDAEIDSFEKTGVISPDAPVHAPLSGTVLQRNVGPGQYVNAGASDAEPVLRIGDTSRVWLMAYVREADAASVKVGQTVRFSVLSHPGRVFETSINYVTAALDPASRRLVVRATIDNSETLLKPEMFADVRIVQGEDGAPSVAVPHEAVIYEADRARVWVLRDGKALETRQIKIGMRSGDVIQVVEGLAAGDMVVTRGSLFVDRATGS